LIIYADMIYTIEAVQRLLEETLSPERLAHCRSTARLSARLCRRYGLDPEKGTLAGLAHDLAREMPAGEVRELAMRDSEGLSLLEESYPVLLHGRAAAVVLRERLGVEDPEILAAVACHVTGRPGMSLLARILFVADLLEPGRGFWDDGYRATVLEMDIDGMMVAALEEIFKHLRSKGRPVAGQAVALYRDLKELPRL
jgi:predicted HD superfamily hydrolase involved in NAD metabolism